ncbi:MAG: GreA/GreB family elongation factor [Candidatus Enteromonas sp.]
MPKIKFQLTQADYDRLVAERADIIEHQMPATREDLELARSQGDLSENEDYRAAKTQLAQLEARYKELNERIDNSEIVEYAGNHVVGIGTKIRVHDHSTDEELEIRIGGHEGAKPFDAIISVSNESPFGQAVLNHKVGDTVTIQADPKYEVTILSIERDQTDAEK